MSAKSDSKTSEGDEEEEEEEVTITSRKEIEKVSWVEQKKALDYTVRGTFESRQGMRSVTLWE